MACICISEIGLPGFVPGSNDLSKTTAVERGKKFASWEHWTSGNNQTSKITRLCMWMFWSFRHAFSHWRMWGQGFFSELLETHSELHPSSPRSILGVLAQMLGGRATLQKSPAVCLGLWMMVSNKWSSCQKSWSMASDGCSGPCESHMLQFLLADRWATQSVGKSRKYGWIRRNVWLRKRNWFMVASSLALSEVGVTLHAVTLVIEEWPRNESR